MILYHSSSLELSVLEPKVGETRHSSEDPRAINQPVIFLTNKDKTFNGVEGALKYRYIVEIDEADPDLSIDESFRELFQVAKESLSFQPDDERYYFYKKPIQVTKTFEWDGERYVERENFSSQ